MISDLKRRKRRCTVCTAICALLLLVAASIGPSEVKVLSAFLFIALLVTNAVIETRLQNKINRLLQEENDRKPIVTTLATVISYRVRYTYHGGGRGGIRSMPHWYVTFRTAARDVELCVPHDAYMACTTGKHGTLRYQGWQFISFK